MSLRRAFVACVAFLATAGGCAKPTTAPVTGTVRYKEQILLSGTIVFQAEDGRVASSNIQSDGTYSIPDAPLGKVKISVQTFPPSPQVVPPDKIDSTPLEVHKYVRIPERYADFQSTDLEYEVRPGKQTHNVELK